MSTRSPNEIHVAEAVADSVRSSIRTLVPAKIVSYDPLRRRATVQPSIRYRRPDGVVEDIPPIPSRPVGLPFGGGWIVSFELSPGDEVALAVFDRNVEGWLARGGIVDAPDARMLQLSDCMAIPMLWSSSRAPKTNLPGEMVIGRDDGSVRIRIKKTGEVFVEGTAVRFGGQTATDGVGRSSLILARLNALHAWALTHMHPHPMGPTSPALPTAPILPPSAAPVGSTFSFTK